MRIHWQTALAGYHLKMARNMRRTVGRLDRDNSGAVIFRKNRTAVSKLMDQAADGRREKIYLALASGHFAENEGKARRRSSGNFPEA